jgi:hypothetical protein
MWSLFKVKDKSSILKEVEILKLQLEGLVVKTTNLKQLVDAQTVELNTAVAKLEAFKKSESSARSVFDFKAVHSFAVERSVDSGGNPVTVIGHVLDNRVKEWHTKCSIENHNELVKSFEDAKRV